MPEQATGSDPAVRCHDKPRSPSAAEGVETPGKPHCSRTTRLQSGQDAPTGTANAVPSRRKESVIDATMAALLAGVTSRVAHLAESGALDRVDPTQLAESMLQAFPKPVTANPMAEQVGPDFYDTDGVIAVLSAGRDTPITKQAVESRRKNWTLVAAQTSDNIWIYPTWQFTDGRVHPAITELIKLFKGQDRWVAADWITTPLEDLDGLSAARWVLGGQSVEAPRQLAAHALARWNQ